MIKKAWHFWRLASVVITLAATGPFVLTNSWHAVQLWNWWNKPYAVVETKSEVVHSEDPKKLIDGHLADLKSSDYNREIDKAVGGQDTELAKSILAVARSRGVLLPTDIEKAVDSIQPESLAADVWDGVKGEADSPAGYAAELTADLFVIGDLRDLVKQGMAIPDQDNVVVALATVGIAASAATAMSGGGAGPAKFGISALKIAKRVGKLNAKLLSSLVAACHGSIHFEHLSAVVTKAGRLDWGGATQSAAHIVDRKLVDQLMAGGTALGGLARKRGPKATLETLNTAESSGDLIKLGKISEETGDKYRGILKLSDNKILQPFTKIKKVEKWVERGAMALGMMLNLVTWMLAAVFWLVACAWTIVRLVFKGGRLLLRSEPRTSMQAI